MEVVRNVVIRGRVQGVGFRVWTQRTALEHGVQGWVRNRSDGSVEALFEGPAEAVFAMIEECRKGPPGAVVEGVDQREVKPDGKAKQLGERFVRL